MTPPVRILMTACGAPGAPGILKCLRANGERPVFVYGIDMNPDAVGFAMADAGEVGPPGQDPGFADAVLRIARRQDLKVVLPLSTMELEPLAAARPAFDEAGVRVLVSDLDGLKVANNKGALMEAARLCGVPVPESVRVRSLGEFEEAVRQLGYPGRPVCFKPEFGKGGRGFRILSPGQDRFAELFDRKPGSALATLEDVRQVLAARAEIPPLLVMEYLPGDEYSVDVLCRDGQCLVAVPRKRTVIRLGICFIGETVKDDRLIDLGARMVRQLNLSYCINLQFKEDGQGVPRLLEINPRVSGTIVLCAAAGVNLPYLAVKLGLGEPPGPLAPAWGVRMVRYWDEVFYDAQGRAFALPDGLGRLAR